MLGEDSSGKLMKKLTAIPTEMTEEYKGLLLDDTRLGVATKKSKPEEKKPAKKKRKRKLPKNAESGITPDPERWVPKWKRAKYRKKFGRKLRETQGEVAGGVQLGPSTATMEVTKTKPKNK